MVTKTIALAVLCPVFLYILGCSGERAALPVSHATDDVCYLSQAPAFVVLPPDSQRAAVLWEGDTPLSVTEVLPLSRVSAGDTLLSGDDPLASIEFERLRMAFDIASALKDTTAVDTLSALLADSSQHTYVTASRSGVLEYRVSTGRVLQPGDTIAVISSLPADSVFTLVPSFTLIRWPAGIPDCTVTDTGLQYRGAFPGDTFFLPGMWSVPFGFIREDGLQTFLVTSSNDTISVVVTGATDTTRIVYSSIPLDSIPFLPW